MLIILSEDIFGLYGQRRKLYSKLYFYKAPKEAIHDRPVRRKVKMPDNAIFIIHTPINVLNRAFLYDFYSQRSKKMLCHFVPVNKEFIYSIPIFDHNSPLPASKPKFFKVGNKATFFALFNELYLNPFIKRSVPGAIRNMRTEICELV